MITFKEYKNGFAIEGHSNREVCGAITLMSFSCAKLIDKLDPSAIYYTSSYDNNDLGVSYFSFNPQISTAKIVFDDLLDSLSGWCRKHYGKEVEFVKHDINLNINVS